MPRTHGWILPMRPTTLVYGHDKPRPWRAATERTTIKSVIPGEARHGWPNESVISLPPLPPQQCCYADSAKGGVRTFEKKSSHSSLRRIRVTTLLRGEGGSGITDSFGQPCNVIGQMTNKAYDFTPTSPGGHTHATVPGPRAHTRRHRPPIGLCTRATFATSFLFAKTQVLPLGVDRGMAPGR